MRKILLFVTAMSVCVFSHAKTHVQTGAYEVPRADGKIVDFKSTIEFEGNSIAQAKKLKVNFPKTLTGEENTFELTKVEGEWTGDKALFDKVDCSEENVFQFNCELHFKHEAIEVVEEEQPVPSFSAVPGFSQTHNGSGQFLAASRCPGGQVLAMASPQQPSFFVNPDQAVENMVQADFSDDEIEVRMASTCGFINEPIGILKYHVITY